jgi:hypothetical protein
MNRQSNWSISLHNIILGYLIHIEAFVDGSVHGSVAELLVVYFGQFASSVRPLYSEEAGGLNLIMLHPARIRIEAQNALIVFYSIRNDVRAGEHPFQSGVRETRLVFCVATTDIGVIAGKPDLLECKIVVFIPVGPPVGNPPAYALFSSIEMACFAYGILMFKSVS